MLRVICVLCGDAGYTASPEQVRCECGGKLKALPDASTEDKTQNQKNNLKEECFVSG